MGFLKRFLSIGSLKNRKNKKKRQLQADPEGRITEHPEDPWQAEVNANRLLRSSSTHFTVVSEIDYASLPPLPHPINHLAITPPISPAPSSRTAASSMKRSGTYTVKVLERVQHSRTEFPRANTPLPPRSNPQTPHNDRYEPDDEELYPKLKEVAFTPRDKSRLYTLRQDPSVASLLNIYDDHGCLDSAIFSNTPPTPAPIQEGREQTKHSGSTLRQLLGGLDEDMVLGNKTTEGDISWAERFLQEQFGTTSPASSTSSLALQTPKDTLFVTDLSDRHVYHNTTLSTDQAHTSSDNYPAISSMEVELSLGTEIDPADATCIVSQANVLSSEPKTPQRGAAEVFGFLVERRKSIRERPLPALPTPAETPEASPGRASNDANTSPVSHVTTGSSGSEAHVYTATVTKLTTAPATMNSYASREELNQYKHSSKHANRPSHRERDHLGSDLAISRTQSTSSSSARELPVPPAPSKIPRGPRGPRPESSSGSSRSRERTDLEDNGRRLAPNDRPARRYPAELTVDAPRQRSRSRSSRTTSASTTKSTESRRHDASAGASGSTSIAKTPVPVRPSHPRAYTQNSSSCDKENENSPSPSAAAAKGLYSSRGVEPITPTTPVRTRTILDMRCAHLNVNVVDVPSPASSSELSPVARDMMADLREKRARTRDRVGSRTVALR